MGMGSESRVISGMGLDFDVIDSGCCGMAGAFGFEEGDHYTVSVEAGERVLLPAVRAAPKETLILADGFSCREQIAQMTDRHALHVSQVLQMALYNQDASAPYPERGHISSPAALNVDRKKLFIAGAVLAANLILLRDRKKNR